MRKKHNSAEESEQLAAVYEQLARDSADGGMAIWSGLADNTALEVVSEHIEQLTGFPAERFKEPGFKRDRIHPQDQPLWSRAAALATEAKRGLDIVYRFKDKNDEWVCLRDIGSFSFSGGKPAKASGVTVVHRDKQTSAMERHEETQILLDMIPAMVWYKDPNNLILRVNKAAADAVGSTPSEMEGRHTAEFYGAAEAEVYYRDDYEVVMSKRPKMGIVEQVKGSDGKKRWVKTDKVPVVGPDGTTCGIVVFSLDVTEDQLKQTQLLQDRRQLQHKIEERTQSLRDTESKLAALSRVVPGVLYQFVLSPDGSRQIPYVSEGARALLGWDPERIQSDAELAFASVHPDELERLADLIAESAQKLNTFRFEGRFFGKDGEIIWLQAQAKPEKLPNGDIIWNGLLSDISDMKQAQEQIKRLNDDLEHRVSILAAVNNELELLTHKLEQSYDQALEASRLKSEFVANISHEVRTPISAVIGMSELLMDTQLSEEQREYTNLVQESALSLLAIINDILDFSKMEAGKIDLELIEFSLLPLIEGCAELLSASARERGLSLMTFVDPRLPRMLYGDPVRLRQVLLNLISNAIKFTEQGEIVIRAEPVKEGDGLISIQFEVIDTGIGLSEAARKLLFQPFVQGDGSTSRKYGGTGLGLSICKRLVELMGGDIGVESELGKGSKFWSIVPFRAHREMGDTSAAQDSLQIRAIVHDESITSGEITTAYLTHAGVSAVVAETANEVIELLHQAAAAERPFNVIIVGTNSGASDLPARVRREYLNANSQSSPNSTGAIVAPPEVRLIMIGPFDDKERIERAIAQGFSACLTRPVRQAQLTETVTKIFTYPIDQLSGRQSRRSESSVRGAVFAAKISTDLPILVAEDNQVMQQLAVRRIQKLGLSADAVSNGREVLEALERQRFAMVLMDCQMPEMDGFETTAEIRRKEMQTGQHIPIIAMTASAMVGDREHCLTSGMDDYLSKPVSQDQLNRILRKWLDIPVSSETATSARSDVSAAEASSRSNKVSASELNARTDKGSHAENAEGAETIVSPSPTSVQSAQVADSSGFDSAAEPNNSVDPNNCDAQQNSDITTVPLIDKDQLIELYGVPDMQSLVTSFIDEALELIEQIKKFRNDKDAREMAMQVHQLKGLSAVMTAEPLAEECRKLEVVTKQHAWDEVDTALRSVQFELNRTVASCRQLLGGTG